MRPNGKYILTRLSKKEEKKQAHAILTKESVQCVRSLDRARLTQGDRNNPDLVQSVAVQLDDRGLHFRWQCAYRTWTAQDGTDETVTQVAGVFQCQFQLLLCQYGKISRIERSVLTLFSKRLVATVMPTIRPMKPNQFCTVVA